MQNPPQPRLRTDSGAPTSASARQHFPSGRGVSSGSLGGPGSARSDSFTSSISSANGSTSSAGEGLAPRTIAGPNEAAAELEQEDLIVPVSETSGSPSLHDELVYPNQHTHLALGFSRRVVKVLQFLLETTNSHLEQITIDVQKLLSQEVSLITSHIFTVAHHGYRVLLQMGLCRDDISFSIAVMKGDRDDQLVWPFSLTVILRLINETEERHLTKMFCCIENEDRLKECLSRPTDRNPAMGYPHFTTRQSLESGGFMRDNCVHLECYFLPGDAVINHPSEVEVPSVISY